MNPSEDRKIPSPTQPIAELAESNDASELDGISSRPNPASRSVSESFAQAEGTIKSSSYQRWPRRKSTGTAVLEYSQSDLKPREATTEKKQNAVTIQGRAHSPDRTFRSRSPVKLAANVPSTSNRLQRKTPRTRTHPAIPDLSADGQVKHQADAIQKSRNLRDTTDREHAASTRGQRSSAANNTVHVPRPRYRTTHSLRVNGDENIQADINAQLEAQDRDIELRYQQEHRSRQNPQESEALNSRPVTQQHRIVEHRWS
jgi:hypothetical protein